MWTFLKTARRSILTLAITTSLAAPAAAETSWDLLSKIEITEVITATTFEAHKTYPEELKAQANSFEITGYFVPVLPQGYQSQFLLVPAPEDCPFCGFGGYGPTLEVHVKRPLPDLPEFSELTVSGRLEFEESTDTYQAVRLVDAVWEINSRG